eukprot:6180287-Pleurochrysis_carterae.AAC.1
MNLPIYRVCSHEETYGAFGRERPALSGTSNKSSRVRRIHYYALTDPCSPFSCTPLFLFFTAMHMRTRKTASRTARRRSKLNRTTRRDYTLIHEGAGGVRRQARTMSNTMAEEEKDQMLKTPCAAFLHFAGAPSTSTCMCTRVHLQQSRCPC